MKYYAHSLKDQPPEKASGRTCYARENQLLAEHLLSVAKHAGIFGRSFGCEYIAYLAGLLHDLGKYTKQFQDYLEKSLRGEKVTRGEVIHALQGSKYVNKVINDAAISDILGNIIASHHGGLFDTLSDGQRTLSTKTNSNEGRLSYDEAIAAFAPAIEETALQREIQDILEHCHYCELNNRAFMLHLVTKALFSCLVDADRCDSAGIPFAGPQPNWKSALKNLEQFLANREIESPIDRIRQRISDQCGKAGSREQGIYTLSIPTGGGKTLSSLRFALEHAKRHSLQRIIYVIPYLSILEQTATSIREALGDTYNELIFEHHSNIDVHTDDDDDEQQYRLLSSRWDSPIILTTMVQFLETIYSNKASRLRKFHNMSNAVLIFDEIQSLPIKCVHLFNEAVNFLRHFAKSSVLLCTATQPQLHKTLRPILLSPSAEIVTITSEENQAFERVILDDKTKYPMNHEEIAALAQTQIEKGKSVLVILNTKRDALGVYTACKPMNCEKTFLTTDLCPAHRMEKLECLRESLSPENKRLTLCVSTQLIEAGVDVSFECVIRAQAGFDSIVQAAGRCNRHKESPTPQTVFVVNVKDEKLSRLPEIQDGKNCTSRVFREYAGENLLDDEVIKRFYEYYFYSQSKKMDYSIKNKRVSIFSLLNGNPIGMVAYRDRNGQVYKGLPSAFQTAADAFSVIEGNQIGVVVPYGDATLLVSQFTRTYELQEKLRILKRLQKYSVTIYAESLVSIRQAVDIVEDTFYVLSPDYYDSEVGLKREAMMSLLNV